MPQTVWFDLLFLCPARPISVSTIIDFTAARPSIINLLDTCLPDDRNDIKVEEDFFSNAPELGIFTLWSTFGNHIDARQLHPSTRRDILRFYQSQKDQFAVRIPQLHDMLRAPAQFSNTSVLILLHCESGIDRTGEVAGAYALNYLNWSMVQVIAWDNGISKSMHPRDLFGVIWVDGKGAR